MQAKILGGAAPTSLKMTLAPSLSVAMPRSVRSLTMPCGRTAASRGAAARRRCGVPHGSRHSAAAGAGLGLRVCSCEVCCAVGASRGCVGSGVRTGSMGL